MARTSVWLEILAGGQKYWFAQQRDKTAPLLVAMEGEQVRKERWFLGNSIFKHQMEKE